ncbi:hypothetical protein ACFQWA_01640 [Streptomyces thermogriseus]|uniref:Secreted protein n=1 Tax=Streptomyces thermogriseus TaxID=75292 RepID=A0ABP4DF16_9ACTN
MEVLVCVVLLTLATAGRPDGVPRLTAVVSIGAFRGGPAPAAQVSAGAGSGTARTGPSRTLQDFATAWRPFLQSSPP